MGLLFFLKNIARTVYKSNQSVFALDVEKQKAILARFPEPRDNYERSFFQYQCQMKKQSVWLLIMQSTVSCILIPIYYVLLSFSWKEKRQVVRDTTKAVFFTDGISIEIIPDCLRAEYSEIISCNFAEKMCLGRHEKRILVRLLKRYWHSPYFVFKCMLKIGMYAIKIQEINPRAIISYSEYSFTSSVLTEYCRTQEVEHINVMHGEKLFNIRDTFVQYDRYFVWDVHYINLLTKLRAGHDQFRIAVPRSVRLYSNQEDPPIYDYTYYLGGEKTEELISIRDALLRFAPGSRTCIRFHPRYCNANEIQRIFKGFQIEYPNDVPLSVSLSQTRNVMSLFSTVLYQAYQSGKDIIIDDVTDKGKYDKLRNLEYIMLEQPHKKLSEYLSNGVT